MAQKKKRTQPPKGEETRSNMLLAILILIAVALGYYVWRTSTKGLPLFPGKKTGLSEGAATPTPKVSPTPTRLRQGTETYTISQASSERGPKIQQLTLDPHEPKVGASQTISVKVRHTSAVQSVTIDLQTDTKSRTLTLTLSQGTSTEGTWQATWTADDSLLYMYKYTITAQAGGQRSTVVVAPRS
jgi:hypothetical protein